MRCRRCYSHRLLRLNKKWPQDNDILRCQECGFLFSPASLMGTGPGGARPEDPLGGVNVTPHHSQPDRPSVADHPSTLLRAEE